VLTLWLAVAGVFSVTEIVTRRHVFGPCAVGAVVAALAASHDWLFYAQASVGLMAALLLLAFVLFVIEEPADSERHIKPEYLISQIGQVSDEVDYRSGQVIISGEKWSARSDQAIAAGSRIKVLQVAEGTEGQHLVVEPFTIKPKIFSGGASS